MFQILYYTANLILLLNFILFLSKFKKNDKAYKIYAVYLGAIVLVQASMQLLIVLRYQNLILSHAYFCLQFILLSLFYLKLMKQNYQRQIIKFNLVLVPLILAVNFWINPSQVHEFCLLEIMLTSITIIGYSVFHFYNMLSNKKEFYFINCGILIYLFGSMTLFLPRNLYTIYGYSFGKVLHILNLVLYLMYLILIFIEWKLINSRNEKQQ
jgi:hypothetical protein